VYLYTKTAIYNLAYGYCMRKVYTNIAVPEELAQEIDKIIAKSKLGYTSRAQFALEAIRAKLKEER